MPELSRWRGIRDVSFTPAEGAAVLFADVEAIEADLTVDEIEDWTADDDWTTFSDITHLSLNITVRTRDVNNALSVVRRTIGTLSWTSIGRGGATNKVNSLQVRAHNVPYVIPGSRDDLSEAEVVFKFVSTDGTTDPTVT